MSPILGWLFSVVLGVSVGIGALMAMDRAYASRSRLGPVDLGSMRAKDLEKTLPESIDGIAASLSAGFSLQQAIDAAGRDREEALSPLWRGVMDMVRSGKRLEEALRLAARQFPGSGLGWVLLSLASACHAGTNMVGSLNRLARVCRDREAARQNILAKTAQARMQGHVLIAIPILFLLGLFVVSPRSLMPVAMTPQGQSLLLIAGALQAIGAYVIRAMVRKDLI